MATTMDTGLLTELRRAVDQSGSWTLMRDSYEAHQLLRFYPDFVDYEIDEDGYAVFTLTPEGMAATSPIKSTTGATEVKQMLEEKINEEKQISSDLQLILEQYEDGQTISYEPDATGDYGREYELAMACYRLGYLTPAWSSSTTANSFRITKFGLDALGMIRMTQGHKSTKSALAAKLDEKIETKVEKFVDPEEWDYLVRMQRGAGISVENPNGPFAYNLAVAQRLLQKGLIKVDGPSEFDPSGVSMVYSLTDAGIAVLMANNKATRIEKQEDLTQYEYELLRRASQFEYLEYSTYPNYSDFAILDGLVARGYMDTSMSDATHRRYSITELGRAANRAHLDYWQSA